MRPVTWRNRSSERSAVTSVLAEPTLRRPHCPATKRLTSPVVIAPRSSPVPSETEAMNRRAKRR